MTHADFEHSAVTDEARCGFLPMLAVMLGFTFFSASMVVGVKMANGLSFGRFAAAVLVSNLVLGVYCAALAFVASRTGLSVHLLSRRVFGPVGSYLPSAILALTQIGWFGVGVAMFAVPTTMFLGLNIWTTNDNAIYTAGLGLSNITGLPKRHLVLVCGFLGTLSSVCLYAHFCGWLNILNVLIPPFGAIILSHLFLCRGGRTRAASPVAAITAWAIGSFAALCGFGYLGWTLPGSGIPALDGMVVSAFAYCLLRRFGLNASRLGEARGPFF